MKDKFPKVHLYRRIVQAKLFIDAHYTESIDLTNISEEACFSKFHFAREFKKLYGKTPHQYLTSVRIENAILLFRSNETVSVVCYAVGFESLSYFGSLFKRRVGVTPSAFLEQQQQLKIQLLNIPLKFVPGCYIQKFGWTDK